MAPSSNQNVHQFDFHSTIRVVYGNGSLNQLGEIARQLGANHTLVVTDTGIRKAGHLERALQSLAANGIAAFVFSETKENPTSKDIDSAAMFARQHGRIDLIVGLGGGSAMDTAKAINFLLTN